MNFFCHICGQHSYQLCEDCMAKAVEDAMRSTKDKIPRRCGPVSYDDHINRTLDAAYATGWKQGRKTLKKRIREAIRKLRIEAAEKYKS